VVPSYFRKNSFLEAKMEGAGLQTSKHGYSSCLIAILMVELNDNNNGRIEKGKKNQLKKMIHS